MLKQYLESVLPSDIVDNKLVELMALTAIFKANHKKLLDLLIWKIL